MVGQGTDNRIRGATALLAVLAVALLLPLAAADGPTFKFLPRERDYRGIAVEEGVYQYHALSGGDEHWAEFTFSVNGSGRADIFLLRYDVYWGELRGDLGNASEEFQPYREWLDVSTLAINITFPSDQEMVLVIDNADVPWNDTVPNGSLTYDLAITDWELDIGELFSWIEDMVQQAMLICGGICLVIIIAIVAIFVSSRRGRGGGGGPQLDLDGDGRVSDTEWSVYKSRRDSEDQR
ncbi:MAG: hypothetical protein VX774_02400 [Candidatus Thermoplasmatota archaeon]|nr:hypothetical protein [Candidatus Thermoplasmatota archaeon]